MMNPAKSGQKTHRIIMSFPSRLVNTRLDIEVVDNRERDKEENSCFQK